MINIIYFKVKPSRLPKAILADLLTLKVLL